MTTLHNIKRLEAFSRVTFSKSLEIENFLEETRSSTETVDAWRAVGYLQAMVKDYERASNLAHELTEALNHLLPEHELEDDEVF